MANTERYDIKTLDEALKIITNPELERVYKKFLSDFSKDNSFTGVYTSKKEIEDSIKERVTDGLNEKFTELKSRISRLRRKGCDVNLTDLKLTSFQFKINFLDADFDLSTYNKLKNILDEIGKMIEPFKDID